jgi:drug/metabolite transporter (DMT)-like permease
MRDFEAVRDKKPLPLDEYRQFRQHYARWTLWLNSCLFGEGFAFIVVPSRWTLVETILGFVLLVTAIALVVFQLTVGRRFLVERRRQGFKSTTWREATRRTGG